MLPASAPPKHDLHAMQRAYVVKLVALEFGYSVYDGLGYGLGYGLGWDACYDRGAPVFVRNVLQFVSLRPLSRNRFGQKQNRHHTG